MDTVTQKQEMGAEETKPIVEKSYTDPKTGKFTPGNPGGGRPAGSFSLITMLKQKLSEVEPGTKKTYAQLFIDRITKSAIADGNDQQIKNILQYIEGMPNQEIKHSGEIAVPILMGTTRGVVNALPGNNGDETDQALIETNTGNSGRDSGKQDDLNPTDPD